MRKINLPACVILDQLECISMAHECGVYAQFLDTVADQCKQTGLAHSVTGVVSDGELVLVVQYFGGAPEPEQNGWVIYRFANDAAYQRYLPYLVGELGVTIGAPQATPIPEASWNN